MQNTKSPQLIKCGWEPKNLESTTAISIITANNVRCDQKDELRLSLILSSRFPLTIKCFIKICIEFLTFCIEIVSETLIDHDYHHAPRFVCTTHWSASDRYHLARCLRCSGFGNLFSRQEQSSVPLMFRFCQNLDRLF